VSALVAVLAGGRGRRMGEPKTLVEFGGWSLISRPLRAAAAAELAAVVVAKPSTPLPELDVPVWHEPEEPVHPLLGIITALERAGRPVVAVACDMPWLPAVLLGRLAAGPEAAVRLSGELQPVPARYEPAHLPALRAALGREASLRTTLASLEPATIVISSARMIASINTPEELAAAQDD
jgi:molybdopterin-guanine dinucleotide biosynthesis protein A